jgi:Tol biopolymer transport system component
VRRSSGPVFVALALALGLAACSLNISAPAAATPTQGLFFPGKPGKGAPDNGVPPAQLAVTWQDLDLGGHFVYLAGEVTGAYLLVDVQVLDLKTGNIRTLFQSTPGAWVSAEAVSPGGKQIVLSYQPPPGGQFGGQEALYVMPADGSSQPTLLFEPDSKSHTYSQPAWSPDGAFVYFTDTDYDSTQPAQIRRVPAAGGKPQTIIDGGLWPSLSSDGAMLVYASVDPSTARNALYFAHADGSDPREVPLSGGPSRGIIDAPIFLAGNQSILFSAPPPLEGSIPGWVDRLFGVAVAAAHAAVSSDWWSVPIAGGTPTRITQLHEFALAASLSPDGKYVASSSSQGIFVMKPDGTNLTSIVPAAAGIPATVSWIP